MFRFSEKSGVHGFSGLHGTSGVYGNSGVYKVSGFNPLDLDPYLLFDAQTSMIGTLENPTLDLDPATPSTLDVITAARAGTATYTDVNGNIATAPANTVRVDQTQGAELTPTKFQNIGYTDFSSGWTTLLGMTVASAGTFEGQPVYRLTTNGAANNIFKTSTPTLDGVTYIASFYIRRISGSSTLTFRSLGSASGSGITLPIIPTEWTRLTVSYLGKSGGGDVEFGFWQLGTGNDVYEIAMPQLEEGTTASSFVENTSGEKKFISSAVYGPRVPMLLIEPSATNTIRWSEDSTGYNYGSGITFETSDVLAPNGQASAFKMTPDGSNATHRGGSSYSGSYNANDVVTTSVWLKTDGYDYFLKVGGFFGAESAMFDSLDGSVQSTEGSVISASSEDYGNGWFRYKVTYTFQNQINNGQLYSGVKLVERDASNNPVESFDGTGDTTGVLVYGTQFELGSVATSYIPTDNDVSGVTRAADDLVISGSDFGFYNQSEGTVYTEFEPRDVSISNKTTLDFSNGTGTERILSLAYSSYHVYVVDGGVEQAHLDGGTYTAGAVNRLAFSYKANNIQVSVSGGAVVSDTSASIPTLDRLQIGASYANSSHLNGHIKRVLFWPTHSSRL